MEITKVLSKIQSELKAPKGQVNSFGKYKYRSCEDILEAIKPHLKNNGCTLTLTDDIVLIGDRYYVKVKATLLLGEESISVDGFARETENKKGMDESQITGAASSYARKYALNGLFCIDDTKDSDSTNTHDKTESKISDKDLSFIRDEVLVLDIDQDKFLKYLAVSDYSDLTESGAKKAKVALAQSRKNRES